MLFATVLLVLSVLLPGCRGQQDFSQAWATDEFALYPKLPIGFTWSKDPACRRDSELLLEGLKNQTYWAMQMYDSSAQSSNGILHGNMYHLGAYDECMLVQQPIQTHMCMVFVTAHVDPIPVSNHTPYALEPPYHDTVWKKIKDSQVDKSKYPRDRIMMGLCLPRSCSREEVEASLNTYLSQHLGHAGQGNRTAYTASAPAACVHNQPEPIRQDEVAFWGFCCALLAFTLTTTFFDMTINKTQKENKVKRVLMSFSLKRNLQKFIAREGEAGPLDYLYGVKFIAICLIIYDHRCAIILGATVFNYQKMEEVLRHYNNLFLPHGDLLVDTFFYIAGLLSCFLLMEILTKRYVNPILVIFARYVRIVPMYMFLVWFHASGLMRLGSGPVWEIGMGNESLNCRENWWTNALFVNNYVHSEHMCILQAWYLAADFHFFTICVFLVYLIINHRRTGLATLICLIAVSAVIPALITTLNHLQPTVIFYPELVSKPRLDPSFQQVYVKSHARATVYFIGVLSGYSLFVNRESKKKYGLGISLLSNTLGLALLFAPMVYGSQYYHPGRPYDPIEAGLFSSLRRIIWALGCVVLMFTYRYGTVPIIGPMNSSRASIVMSKLTYGMYLIHFTYQMADYAKTRVPHFINLFDFFKTGTGDVVMSMFYALLLYLLIELPTRSIFKELVFSRVQEEHVKADKEGKEHVEGHDNPVTVKTSDEINHKA